MTTRVQSVRPMQGPVIQAIHARRSIRAYRAEPVARALIEDLLWAAAQAPTPPVSGASAWAFCVIEGAERLAGFGDRALRHAREHRSAADLAAWADRPGFKVFWDAPVLVLMCARDGNREAPFDCCRAGQNLLIAAHAAGLGACWVGAPMAWLHAAGVAAELGLPTGFSPSVAIVLGHPAESPAGEPRPRPLIHWC